MGRAVDLPRVGVGGGQFLGRKEGRGWRLRKIGGKRVGVLCLVGRSHIRRVKAFRSQDLFGVIRRKQWLG